MWPVGGFNTLGLAWADGIFYQGINYQGDRFFEMDAELKPIRFHNVPFNINGLAWDGSNLWISTGELKQLRKYQSGELVDSVAIDVSLSDIVWVDGELFGIEKNENILLHISLPEQIPDS